jgi:hypothetical protein
VEIHPDFQDDECNCHVYRDKIDSIPYHDDSERSASFDKLKLCTLLCPEVADRTVPEKLDGELRDRRATVKTAPAHVEPFWTSDLIGSDLQIQSIEPPDSVVDSTNVEKTFCTPDCNSCMRRYLLLRDYGHLGVTTHND